jgi:hypothetical protein
MLCSVISIGAVALMKDHTGKDISREYDSVPMRAAS